MKKTVKVTFHARKKGSIGRIRAFEARVEVPRHFTREDIIKALSESFDTVQPETVFVRTKLNKKKEA